MGDQHDGGRLSARTGDPRHRLLRAHRGAGGDRPLGDPDRDRVSPRAQAFRLALWLGRRLGDALHAALPGRREVALDNIAVAFPERSPSERRALCRAAFHHLGMMLVESALLVVLDPGVMLARVSADGIEHLEAAAKKPGGVLVLTAHFGNWELLGLAHVLSGLPLTVVARPLDSALLNRLVAWFRRRTGAELIAKRRALKPVLDALRRGRMVAILLDQNASRGEGVFVPFFGRPASTSRGLALLALRTGRSIVPIFIHREPDGHHRIVVEPPLPSPPAASTPVAVLELTAECARRIEATIRRWPEQWFWLHRRWRTRPSPP